MGRELEPARERDRAVRGAAQKTDRDHERVIGARAAADPIGGEGRESHDEPRGPRRSGSEPFGLGLERQIRRCGGPQRRGLLGGRVHWLCAVPGGILGGRVHRLCAVPGIGTSRIRERPFGGLDRRLQWRGHCRTSFARGAPLVTVQRLVIDSPDLSDLLGREARHPMISASTSRTRPQASGQTPRDLHKGMSPSVRALGPGRHCRGCPTKGG